MTGLHKLRAKGLLLGIGLAGLSLLVPLSAGAYSEMQSFGNYTYDKNRTAVAIPDAYVHSRTVALACDQGIAAKNPQDMYVAPDGRIVIADTDNNRILVLDENYRFLSAVSEITDITGAASTLNKPEGVYVYESGELLIADTQNGRIVRCDAQGNASRIIGKPAGMTGVSEESQFLPVKLSVDKLGRIHVIARNINYGILQLDEAGTFLGFIGAPSVQPDLFTLFWRQFSTQAQKDQMVQFVTTEYSNLYIDEENFIWGTISTLEEDDLLSAIANHDRSGSVTPIRRLNALGNDLLKRNGQSAPLGDLDIEETPSKIIDVAVGSSGMYSMLDSTRGHIFTYDVNGNLLYIFGSLGLKAYEFQRPAAISYVGRSLVVLDAGLHQLQVFEPTAYGSLVYEAVSAQYEGDFASAYALWTQLAAQNSNFEYAFIGLGNAKLDAKQYTEAMAYFKHANDTEGYSKAFTQWRRQFLQDALPVVLTVVIVVSVALLIFFRIRKIYRYYKNL